MVVCNFVISSSKVFYLAKARNATGEICMQDNQGVLLLKGHSILLTKKLQEATRCDLSEILSRLDFKFKYVKNGPISPTN